MTVSLSAEELVKAEGGAVGRSRVVYDRNRYLQEAGSSSTMDMKMSMALMGEGQMTMSVSTTMSLSRIR